MGQAKRKGTLEHRIALSKATALLKIAEREAQEKLALEMMTDELWELTDRRRELRYKRRSRAATLLAALGTVYDYQPTFKY